MRILQKLGLSEGRSRGVGAAGIYFSANLVSGLIPLTLLPVLTRYLQPEEYGEVAMFQTFIAILAAFVGLGVHAAANRRYYDRGVSREDMARYVGSCLEVLLASTLCVSIAIWALRGPLSAWLGLRESFMVAAVLVSAGTFVVNLRLGQYQVRGQALRYGGLQVLQSALNMALSIFLVVVLLRKADGRIEAQIIAVAVAALGSLLLLKRDRILSFGWDKRELREITSFGVQLIPHVAGAFLLVAADRLIIVNQLGMGPVGVYMAGVQIAMGVGMLVDSINKSYVPWLYKRLAKEDREVDRRTVRITYAYYAVLLAGAGLTFLVGGAVVGALAGPRYQEAGKIVGWLVLGHAFKGMYYTVTNYIFYSKKTRYLSFVTLFSGCLAVAMTFLLVGQFGLVGASYSFALAMLVQFFLAWILAHRVHAMPWFGALA